MNKTLRHTMLAVAVMLAVSVAAWAQQGLGQRGGVIPPAIANQKGLLVVAVVSNSPAAKAGIMRGDIITAVQGKEVNTVAELRNVLRNVKAGDTISVDITRGGNPMSLKVTTEDLLLRPALGVYLEGARPAERAQLPAGALVIRVENGSPAEKAGIVRGDVIVQFDGKAVDPATFANTVQSHKPGDVVTLQIVSIQRNGGSSNTTSQPKDVSVTLGTNPSNNEAYLGIQFTNSELLPGFRFGGFGRGLMREPRFGLGGGQLFGTPRNIPQNQGAGGRTPQSRTKAPTQTQT